MRNIPGGFWGTLLYAAVLIGLAILLAFLLAAGGRAEETVRLPILLYHDVIKDGGEPGEYAVTEDQLRSDLRALKAGGWETVSLTQTINFVRRGDPLPEKPVLLVFDDGYKSLSARVNPLLEELDARAVVSVIGARAQGVWDGCDTGGEYLSWEELGELAASGRIELQSHSASLHVFRTRKGVERLPGETAADYETVLTRDIERMRAWAREARVTLLPAFAYPYGFVDPLADAIFAENGFSVTMTSEPHINTLTRDPDCLLRLGRLNRSGLIQTEAMIRALKAAG